MGKKIDLIGQKFNFLTVIEETPDRSRNGGVIWRCLCDCGNITTAQTSELRSGHKKSCGCYQRERIRQQGFANLIDITGQTYGLLTVIKKVCSKKTQNGSTKIIWKCQCKCGNTCEVEDNALKTGNTKSCGCLKSQGEQKITALLQNANINFEKEKIFTDAKQFRFDFFVNNSYIIEYDGIQHFQENFWGSHPEPLSLIQQRDRNKNQYCKLHNIPLIRIPYTHLENLILEDLLLETTQFCFTEKGENKE